MAVALSWEAPGVANWIAADDAYFVVGSDAIGGMGAAEAVPFSDRRAADSFAAQHGGRVTKLGAITNADVLAPVADGTKPAEEHDYLDRLQALSKERQGES